MAIFSGVIGGWRNGESKPRLRLIGRNSLNLFVDTSVEDGIFPYWECGLVKYEPTLYT